MVKFASNERLIQALATDLKPVCRSTSPLLRALAWLALVAAIAVALPAIHDLEPALRRFSTSTDLCATAIGSMLTAALACLAAFQLSLPDRNPSWALLPVPAAVLWVGSSATDCLKLWALPAAGSVLPDGTCPFFILGVSTPLSILLLLMLRSGYSLRPNLTSMACGLACSAAAATLLNLIHAHDETTFDLAIHAFAVCVVILVNRIFGSRFLVGKYLRSVRNNNHALFELISIATFERSHSAQDWTEHAEDYRTGNHSTCQRRIRTDHQGHVIRFHRQGRNGG